MSKKSNCQCSTAPKLIFACSGAADVGEISDRAARKLTNNGNGKMFCLAGIGGRVSDIMKSTNVASAILAIDGCKTNCARKCLIEAGFIDFKHLQLSELDLPKGASEVSEANISKVVNRGAELLQNS